jgi:hypothetical protein
LQSFHGIKATVTCKLQGSNYVSRTSQFVPAVKANELMGILDGIEPSPCPILNEKDGQLVNPEYVLWQRKDQFLLSFINSTLADKFFATVYGLTNSRQV